jgi:hypothetical protein
MATLSIRPRRTKGNRFPLAVGPLARWRKDDTHMALRADGSMVRRGEPTRPRAGEGDRRTPGNK